MSIIDPLTCGFAKVITYIPISHLTTNHTKNKNPVREKNVRGKLSKRNTKVYKECLVHVILI